MLKFFFAFALGVHGAIHMIGFAKAANPTSASALTLPVSKGFGSLWMACAFLFIAAAGTYLSRKDWWWMAALAGVLLSQYLVFCFWADARYGSLMNVVVALAVAAGIAHWQFRRAALHEVAALYEGAGRASVVVDETMLRPLPPVVARWLRRAGVAGQPLTRSTYIRQSGEMRTSPEGHWMPFAAEQWFNAGVPGFVWLADIAAAPGVHIAGRDTCMGGKGRMLIKAMSVYPIADATGPEVDQGALLRYLAEIIWFPSAALRDYITWEATGDAGATATLTLGGQTVTAEFAFNADGDPVSVSAARYYAQDGGATLERWHVALDPDSFADFQGVRLPARATVTWKLAAGDFEWYRVEVDSVARNQGGKT